MGNADNMSDAELAELERLAAIGRAAEARANVSEWDENVERAHQVLDSELLDADAPRLVKIVAAGIVAIIQAIDEVREMIPSEPFQVEDVTPKYPRT